MRWLNKFNHGFLIVLTTLLFLINCFSHVYGDHTQSGDIIVNPVKGLPVDFIRGVDASEAPWIIEIGGRYYDFNGVEKHVLDILWESNVNWVRLRIWNDPYSVNGEPYGGGNCDLKRMTAFAVEVVKRGFKILVDLHYSDWWADPSKQYKPKAWLNLSYRELVQEVYNWTFNTLKYMGDRGVKPSMIQIGNEINNGFLWPDGSIDNWSGFTELLKTAIRAVRDFDQSIKIVIHLAGIDENFYTSFIDKLIASGVDFDVIGISYYPYWHGSLSDLGRLLRVLSKRYDKEIIIAETAYAWTLDNGDEHPNIYGLNIYEVKSGYKASIQGQTSFIRDLIEVLIKDSNGKAIGLFYWGATWIPYPGAGWKTGEGNPWDNQALFDFNGRALPSLKVFKLVYEGVERAIKPLEPYNPASLTIHVYYSEQNVKLPGRVLYVFTDHSIREVYIEWITQPVYTTSGQLVYKGYIVGYNVEVYATLVINGSNSTPINTLEERSGSTTSLFNTTIYASRDVDSYLLIPLLLIISLLIGFLAVKMGGDRIV